MSPLRDPDGFVRSVAGILSREGVDVLLPISEASLMAILPRRTELPQVGVPFPSYQRFRTLCDKEAVLERARELGMAVPAQRTLETPADSERLDPERLEYPLVLKPSRSVVSDGGRLAKHGAVHISDHTGLKAELKGFPAYAYPLLLQQRIVGDGIGVFMLLWNGDLLGSFAHRRLREKPPSGGVSVYRESVELDAVLRERSRALLQRLEWEGVAMVEYKREHETGELYLMEVNPRFWGSLQLAIDAGVDFPRLLVAAALGDSPMPVRSYRTGVRVRWFWGDVDHLLTRVRHSREELELPDGSPGRLKAIADFLMTFLSKNREEVLRLQDPKPFLRETVDWVKGALTASTRRRA